MLYVIFISWNSEADKDDGELSEDSNSGLPETKPDELSHPVIRETADNEPPADRSPILFFIHGINIHFLIIFLLWFIGVAMKMDLLVKNKILLLATSKC